MPRFCATLVFYWTKNPPRGSSRGLVIANGVVNSGAVWDSALGISNTLYTHLVAADGEYDLSGNLVGVNVGNAVLTDDTVKRHFGWRDAGSGTHLSPFECEWLN